VTGLAYSSPDNFLLSGTFFFGAKGFWSGDLAKGNLATGAFSTIGFFEFYYHDPQMMIIRRPFERWVFPVGNWRSRSEFVILRIFKVVI
jgi:hypothetical protein